MNWRGLARRSIPYAITAASGFLLAYLIIAIFVFPSSILPTDRKVPNVVGMTYDDATRELDRSGFRPATRERRYHASAPEGMVLEQEPVAGAVEGKGATVSLDVSRGQRMAEVPQVSGMTVTQAQAALESVGFEVGNVTRRDSEEPRGQVIAVEPREGTRVPVPATVTLVVSGGPTTIAVPDVTGQSGSEAQSLLQQVGFRVRMEVDSFSSMPPNTVVSQTPAAGSHAPVGTTVTITTSGSTVP
ncbi:MAG TPA: PASTA domain-containing protein [Gemmatimonadaceae bacterium]|nr:PASTA domain-containing protein [Gemmatimonadaceae bacterium]